MTNCLLGFSTPFDLTICSNSNLRATKFSATRLPTSCGELPAGQFLKYLDCARALLQVITTNAVATSNASAFDCLSIFTPSNFYRACAPLYADLAVTLIVIELLVRPVAEAVSVIRPEGALALRIAKQRP